MPRINIVKKSLVKRSVRTVQLSGIFDIPDIKETEFNISADLPFEEKEWSVGLIVGPSGSGKSTVLKELFQNEIFTQEINDSSIVVDLFDKSRSVKDVTEILSSVGFSSPPSWLKPFGILSNGEKFRVECALTLAQDAPLVAIDEFTSLVDRQVAKIASHCVQKYARKNGKKIVAATCHYDVEDWLQPDWVFDPALNRFFWRSLRRRPEIKFTVSRINISAWQLFKKHHYLSSDINKVSRCYGAFIDNKLIAMCAILSFPHSTHPAYRIHRTVCLPDFQGVGIGNALADYVASLYSCFKPVQTTTSHPAMIKARNHSPNWNMTRTPSVTGLSRSKTKGASVSKTNRWNSYTASFRYIGPKNPEDAAMFGISRNSMGY